MRLFIAVNFPFEIKKGIGSFIQDLRKVRSDMKWVEPENLHLTVQFIGNVSENEVPAVTAALNRVAARIARHLEVKGLAIPSGKARVFWAGAGGDTAALLELSRQVQRAGSMGLLRRKRNFHPSNFNRLRSPAGFAVMDRAESGGKQGVWFAKISTVDLMLSELGPRGPKYFTLAWPLTRVSTTRPLTT